MSIAWSEKLLKRRCRARTEFSRTTVSLTLDAGQYFPFLSLKCGDHVLSSAVDGVNDRESAQSCFHCSKILVRPTDSRRAAARSRGLSSGSRACEASPLATAAEEA